MKVESSEIPLFSSLLVDDGRMFGLILIGIEGTLLGEVEGTTLLGIEGTTMLGIEGTTLLDVEVTTLLGVEGKTLLDVEGTMFVSSISYTAMSITLSHVPSCFFTS